MFFFLGWPHSCSCGVKLTEAEGGTTLTSAARALGGRRSWLPSACQGGPGGWPVRSPIAQPLAPGVWVQASTVATAAYGRSYTRGLRTAAEGALVERPRMQAFCLFWWVVVAGRCCAASHAIESNRELFGLESRRASFCERTRPEEITARMLPIPSFPVPG